MILRPSQSIVLNLRNKWEEGEGGLYRGSILDNDDLNDGTIFKKPWDADDLDEMLTYLKSLQGFFSCVLFDEDRLLLIVDHVRSHPLYYRVSGKNITVTDDPQSIFDPKQDSLSTASALDFLCLGYVTGENTLMEGIKQVEPGTCVSFQDGKLEKRTYFDYRPDLVQSVDPEAYYDNFLRALESTFHRLRIVTKGKQIAIPLSGGFDSRLIALCLKRFDFSNVIAFSYGPPGNKDSKISKQIAGELGFDWFFVPYSIELWSKVAKSKSWSDYCSCAFQLTSVPHLQDFPAIESLVNEGIIAANATVTPGIRIPGVRVPRFVPGPDDMVSKHDLLDAMVPYHYSLWRFEPGSPLDRMFRSQLSDRLSLDMVMHKTVAASKNGNWFLREREAKFLVNSVRCYELHGLRWWLPLMDKGLASFWEKAVYDCKQKACFDQSVRKLTQEVIGDPDRFGRARWSDNHGGSSASKDIDKKEGVAAPETKSYPLNISLDWIRKSKFTNKLLYELGYHREVEYYDSDYAFFGVIDKKEFLRTYTGRENINSFIALDLLKAFIDPKSLSPSDKEQFRSILIFKSNMLKYLERNARRRKNAR